MIKDIKIGKLKKVNTYTTNFNNLTEYDLSLNWDIIYSTVNRIINKKGFAFDEDAYMISITEWYNYKPKDDLKNINLLIKIYTNRKKNIDGISKTFSKNRFWKNNILRVGTLYDIANNLDL